MYKTVQINYCRKVFCVITYPCVLTSVPLTCVWAFGFVGCILFLSRFGFFWDFLAGTICLVFATVWTLLHGISYMWACSPSILHGIGHIWACSPSILHGICYMWACSPSILYGICYMLACSPSILHGIFYMWTCSPHHHANPKGFDTFWHGHLHYIIMSPPSFQEKVSSQKCKLRTMVMVSIHTIMFTTSSCQPQLVY